jgi:D-alanyl-D-alanine dipeptidase
VISLLWAALVAAPTLAPPRAAAEHRGPAASAAALVEVAAVVPDAIVDLRYATADNLAGRAVYPADARCLLLAPVADRLARVAGRLRAEGLRLVLWDCYRPLAVQRELWRLVPRKGLVADPARGSHHNRGAAVDVAVAAADGGPVPLPTGFDDVGRRARLAAVDGVAPEARRNRERLRAAMEAEGFRPNRMEWWHYDAPEARGAPVLEASWPRQLEGPPRSVAR